MNLIEQGTYILADGVANPRPDKRSNRWHCGEILPEGRYIVTAFVWSQKYEDDIITIHEIKFRPERSSSYSSLRVVWREHDGVTSFDDTTKAAAIVATLSDHWKLEETLEGDLVLAHENQHINAAEILLYLAEHRVIPTRDTTKLAIAALHERDEREWAEQNCLETKQ